MTYLSLRSPDAHASVLLSMATVDEVADQLAVLTTMAGAEDIGIEISSQGDWAESYETPQTCWDPRTIAPVKQQSPPEGS
jgi:hypothetical protein